MYETPPQAAVDGLRARRGRPKGTNETECGRLYIYNVDGAPRLPPRRRKSLIIINKAPRPPPFLCRFRAVFRS